MKKIKFVSEEDRRMKKAELIAAIMECQEWYFIPSDFYLPKDKRRDHSYSAEEEDFLKADVYTLYKLYLVLQERIANEEGVMIDYEKGKIIKRN